MNRWWTRIFRSTSRKEPISSFILIVGTVDTVIGGISAHTLLLALGLSTMSAALLLRWQLTRSRQSEPIAPEPRAPIRYLPDRTSRPSLPTLDLPRKPSS